MRSPTTIKHNEFFFRYQMTHGECHSQRPNIHNIKWKNEKCKCEFVLLFFSRAHSLLRQLRIVDNWLMHSHLYYTKANIYRSCAQQETRCLSVLLLWFDSADSQLMLFIAIPISATRYAVARVKISFFFFLPTKMHKSFINLMRSLAHNVNYVWTFGCWLFDGFFLIRSVKLLISN